MSENSLRDAIAIVGMACRLPGADNLAQYWDLVHSGSSAIAPLPADRLNRELYFHPERGQLCKTYSDLGGLVRPRPFDRGRCPIPEETIDEVDVAHLTLLEVAAEACRDSGYDPFQLPFRNVGVFVGHTGGSPVVSDLLYSTVVEEGTLALDHVEQLRQLGLDPRAVRQQIVEEVRRRYPGRKPKQSLRLGAAVASELISESFGLSGPYGVVDAACASSLQALSIGVRALLLGRLDAALVGSASYCKSDSLVLFSAAQSVSSNGSCPFSREADGLISAEGYVVFMLKTVEKAVRDGDRIHAVISGLGVSSDGRGKSLWAPRTEGQILAVERAYAGNLDANRLQYIEAHATSTQVGDATELQALSQSLSNMLKDPTRKIPIGSVKGNVGHTLETAGVAGLLKTVLAINKQTIPPAVRFRELNSEIDWPNSPFYVPFEPQSWPEFADGHPRRAAVNSFGIGGLNVHVVVDEFQPTATGKRTSVSVPGSVPVTATSNNIAPNEPIAIIGMGCVLPGAHTIEAFWDLLSTGRDPKTTAPADRIPGEIAYAPGEAQTWKTYCLQGGFVEGWEYDWRRHKIPPKQIAQANPLQFMLLDAADQAFQHAKIDLKTLQGTRVSAIVGTIFGGDFSDHLQMGLRLPEIRKTIRDVLSRQGIPADKIAEVEVEFQKRLLAKMPALLDETGSFTSSTLASRLTKSFNLMGGALAVDGGNCSAALVLQAAIDQLRLGHVDMVVCASGQRSMDLWTYEGLSLADCLAKGNPPASLQKGNEGVLPGEGCGVLLLKRLSDAQRDGNPIQGVIRGISAFAHKDLATAIEKAGQAALQEAAVPASAIMAIETHGVRDADQDPVELQALLSSYAGEARSEKLAVGDITSQIGHTGGASAMAGVLKSALAAQAGVLPPTLHLQQPEPILANTTAVQAASAALPLATVAGTTYRAAAISSIHNRMVYQIVVDNGAPLPQFAPTPTPLTTTTSQGSSSSPLSANSPARIVRFAAENSAALRAQLLAPMAGIWQAQANQVLQANALLKSATRCTMVASSVEELAQKATLAADIVAKERHNLAADHGIFFATEQSPAPQVAFLFPGQGSQYATMLQAWWSQDPAVQADVAAVDKLMQRHGFSTFRELAWNAASPLGTDVWVTQASLLLADWLVFRAAERLGIRADFIAGHSYGEFPALVAAGVWSLEDALLATRARCQAVVAAQATPTMMLSVMATRSVVESLLQSTPRQVWLCAENGPEQCVVGGPVPDVQAFAEQCTHRHVRTKALAVPCAFHTPLLASTQAPLQAALSQRSFRSPQVRFASTTYPCFVQEPNDLCASLVEQMTHPVEFVATIRRLLAAGANTFIEIGPSTVLTQLTARIVPSDQPTCRLLALDTPKKSPQQLALRLQAACEAWGIALPGSTKVENKAAAAAILPPIRMVDATMRRRQRLREKAHQQSAATTASAGARPAPAPVATSYTNGSHSPPAPVITPATVPWDERTARLIFDVMSVHGLPVGSQLDARANWPQQVQNGEAFVEDLAECFNLNDAQFASLRRTLTIGELVALLHACPGKTDWLEARQRANSPATSTTELEQILIDFVVDQTGYPAEIVELDADLEGDLGIDSIKKAQLFGELGERFRLSADPNMSLDDFPTLGHVLHYLQKHVTPEQGGAKSSPPRGNAPTATTTGETLAATEGGVALLAPPSEATSLTPDSLSDIETFLVNFVVEQTGYPAEIVELDADLEADLGIDSIKKAQLFGEIGNQFQLSADPNLSLDDFPTLRHVLTYLQRVRPSNPTARLPEAPPRATSPAPAAAANGKEAHREFVAASAPAPEALAASPANAAHELQNFLVNFVVEQTGYPAEIIELDADLEADLGIDSIKKAQLFGEIGNHFQLSADPNLSLDDFPTLRHVHDYLTKQIGVTENAPASRLSQPPAASTPALSFPATSARNAAYDRGFLHGRAQRELIRTALRHHVASRPLSTTDWVNELTADEHDELAGIAAGADVLLSGLLAWQSALGSVKQPLTSRADAVAVENRQGLVIQGWACTSLPLCMESADSYLAVRIPGQLGALAVLTAQGDVFTIDTAAAETQDHTLPAAVALVRNLQARNAGQLASQLQATAVASLARSSSNTLSAASLSGLQKQLEHASGPPWLSAHTAMLGGLPNYQAFQLVVLGQEAWIRWHDDGARQNGASRWERVTMPFSLPTTTLVAEKPRSPVRFPEGNRITQRYLPRLTPAPAAPELPAIARATAVILVGDAPRASELARELQARGVTVHRLDQRQPLATLESQMQTLVHELPHASLILALDQPRQLPDNQAAWDRAAHELLLIPFRICQLWLTLPRTSDQTRTLLALTDLGGGFGYGSAALSPWSGALTGLLKSIRNEFPGVTVRAIDLAEELTPAASGRLLVSELFSADKETEIALRSTGRHCVRYERTAATSESALLPQAGEQWVVTGGARGITGVVAKALALRYGVRLHLLGSTALSQVEPTWLSATPAELKQIRGRIMVEAKGQGNDPLVAWSRIEKTIEVQQQLAKLREAGIEAIYHVCDLANWQSLADVLGQIRQRGPIRGILHGAGFEAAAKLEKKKLPLVERTLSTKAGGAAALIALTATDPIDWFISFGSTSGRLGGLGQADYGMANDLLAKQMDWLRRERPRCRATVFHWHAWDEIGMAARPESRFALESFGLRFMPPAEGVAYLLAEIEAGLPEPEVMITEELLCPASMLLDSAPAPLANTSATPSETTQVAPAEQPPSPAAHDWAAYLTNFVVEQTGYPPEIVDLDADLEADLGIDSIKKAQLFGELGEQFQLRANDSLSLDDFPTLRHVMRYLENHVGAASAAGSTLPDGAPLNGAPPVSAPPDIVSAVADQPLQVPLFTDCVTITNQSYVVKGKLDPAQDVFLNDHRMLGRPVLPGVTGCELLAQAVAARTRRGRYVCLSQVEVAGSLRFPTDDVRSVEVTVESTPRSQRAVVRSLLNDRRNGDQDPRREHVTGEVAFPNDFPLTMPTLEQPPFPYNPMVYPDDAAMYHGYSMRTLDGLIFQNGGGWGRIKPSAIDSLAGPRPKTGWILPMAQLDGCIVGCAVFSWLMLGRRVEIPQGFGELWLLREPLPNEKLQMQFQFLRSDDRNSWYHFDLFTNEGETIASCRNLRLVKFGKDELP